MTKHSDSLRGYSYEVHKRDNFICQYCGVDGTKSFDTWLSLSRDHLLPKGHPDRENKEFIVTACQFCNTADNRYFDMAEQRGLTFDGKNREALVAQRLKCVEKTRQEYRDFWEKEVKPLP